MFPTGAAGKPSSGLQDPQKIWQFLNEAVSLANPALLLNPAISASPGKVTRSAVHRPFRGLLGVYSVVRCDGFSRSLAIASFLKDVQIASAGLSSSAGGGDMSVPFPKWLDVCSLVRQ